ncbi:ABC transporter ATP-binding protein [Sedimentibacter sp. zth1]|uniref:ABC transporter ATP-binding protein n=1 Tax=Sedimentibacter sp. zth1 TaxID=2816908 RepID=UPI001A923E08|nr:ABC transporter ATP-binding protein [Sedimentibacter sp. zth1]QSX07133.1 ABC transporter ATP-binding protein [Sedimentibacter sp. zth1]
MNNLIIKDISKSYKKTHALNAVNLNIEDGMFGLLGENGAGKTTLMRILSTIIIPDKGEINFGDLNWHKSSDKVRSIIGYLPQKFGAFKNITAKECLEYIATLKGLKNKRDIISETEKVMSYVNLCEHRDKKISTFSGGMLQRLGIAQALLNNPQIIIVDEPTAGLDPKERIRFRNLLRNLSKERIVILSTHIVDDIEATCKSLAVIKNGFAKQFNTLSELSSLANNKVWIWELSYADYNKLNQDMNIISVNHENNTIKLRILAELKPSNDSISVKPNIEEGYILWNIYQDTENCQII